MNAVRGEAIIDGLYKARRALRTSDLSIRNPTVFMSPQDWDAVCKAVESASPIPVADPLVPLLWGLPVVVRDDAPTGFAYIGEAL